MTLIRGPSVEYQKCVWGSLGEERVGRALCSLSGGFVCDATSSHDLHLLVACKPMSAVQVDFSFKLSQHVRSTRLKLCTAVWSSIIFDRLLLPFDCKTL